VPDKIARASIEVNAPAGKVWDALVDPRAIHEYMFGTTVVSDWEVGGPITWKGSWKGKPYQDRGTILAVDPPRALSYDHYSPLTGPDVPENHHTVTIALVPMGERTGVTLTQDNNQTLEARLHSEENWRKMLEGLQKYVEGA
jgi:uncharacterized protein YndB with AHSA1/START domain